MAIKLLNPKMLVSSLETITVQVYLHNGAFIPVLGSTTLGYRLYGADGLAAYGLFIENVAIPGLYEANVETNLADPLLAGTYYVVVYDSTATTVIAAESVASQFSGLNSVVEVLYKPMVKVTGVIASIPADVTVTIVPNTGALVGVPAAATVDGNTGEITFNNPSILILETLEDHSVSLDGDPTGTLVDPILVTYPNIIKAAGTAIANDPADITVNFTLGSGFFVPVDQVANAVVNNLGITFDASDLVIQDTYSFMYAAGTTVTIPVGNASFLVNAAGVLASVGADATISVNAGLPVNVDDVNGITRVVDFATVAGGLVGGEAIDITFFRLPDATLTAPDSLTIDYNRLPVSNILDTFTVTYRVPSTIDVVQFEKGADLAAAEILLEFNQQREFNIATQNILDRNVAAGNAESMTIKTKNSTDTDFSVPVTEGTVKFTYRELSLHSDIIKAEPEA